ncbi:hypothetical protein Phum_PHUM407260 [Pediculus humanus corporis]|uniref:Uncharacterized protein n=1 Tax=Pediculus humanus subsp. corporis TaxID=121224 RepID=E0VRY5_PEDHC|nr:uncharacterized protein Phum_PHUM407260 [Pediculus humanus corporis]EEB16141.1 hypothetical protein Phum_PHUM407260 [Pediculus humanus corporis]
MAGKKVCLTAFLYLQHVTLYQMKRLRSHLKNHGVSPRIHGNRGRKPANTFSLDIYHCATNFVQDYIEKHCVKSVPNFTTFSYGKTKTNCLGNTLSGSNGHATISKTMMKKTTKMKIPNKITSYHLPSECTKKTVHKEYKSFCENLKPSQKAMKYSTFTSFLQKQFPNVKFSKVDKKINGQVEKITLSQHQESERGKSANVKDGKEEKDNQKDNFSQTTTSPTPPQQQPPILYYPTKTIQVTTQNPTLVLSTEENSPRVVVYNKTQAVATAAAPAAIVKMDEMGGRSDEGGSSSGGSGSSGSNGSGSSNSSNNELQMDFRFSNRILIDGQIYEGETCENVCEEEMYATDNVA